MGGEEVDGYWTCLHTAESGGILLSASRTTKPVIIPSRPPLKRNDPMLWTLFSRSLGSSTSSSPSMRLVPAVVGMEMVVAAADVVVAATAGYP